MLHHAGDSVTGMALLFPMLLAHESAAPSL
ncbi:hypothetical protein L585_11435 [Pantoea ananatis BRT175]|nr:hypothetical protein L585_11435 [Pantoea ananatis BRT175]